jgi:hypothetical protein
MKITSITSGDAKENITVMKPIQYLLITGKAASTLDKVYLRVQLINSNTGSTTPVITQISLQTLGEIATMNEGHFIWNATTKLFKVHVMLHPNSAVRLDNDKYLQIEISGLDCSTSNPCNIYGIESTELSDEFIVRYSKLYVSSGEEIKLFTVGTNEELILPFDMVDELQLNCSTGVAPVYTPEELKAKQRLQNDLVFVNAEGTNTSLCCGTLKQCSIDLENVDSFEIRRNSNHANISSSIEIILLDLKA